MRVTVTGATGMIGRALVRALLERGDSVTVLSRDPDRAVSVLGDVRALDWGAPKSEPPPHEALEGQDGVVHLLGEPIAQRWSDRAKREIRDSRVLSTRRLVSALAETQQRPAVLVSQSATGWYGARGEEPVDESAPPAADFLAGVVAAWEAEAARAGGLGMRVVMTRTGVVVSESGGALEKMLTPFKLGVGGPVAGGRQYVPWIHEEDVVGALIFCLDNPSAAGPVNLTAPEPVTNRELSRALGRALRRPAVMPVPALAVRALYGEMAMVVTTGARARPRRLEQLGYEFRRPDLDSALGAVIGR